MSNAFDIIFNPEPKLCSFSLTWWYITGENPKYQRLDWHELTINNHSKHELRSIRQFLADNFSSSDYEIEKNERFWAIDSMSYCVETIVHGTPDVMSKLVVFLDSINVRRPKQLIAVPAINERTFLRRAKEFEKHNNALIFGIYDAYNYPDQLKNLILDPEQAYILVCCETNEEYMTAILTFA